LTALVPCIGSALIIGAGESGSSVVYSVLSWRPVVFVGLISYSLYLWHWPVIMIDRMGILDIHAAFERRFSTVMGPDRFDHIVQIVVSVILGIVSWRFVERPFRKGRLRLAGPPLFILAGVVMLVCITLSSVVIFTGGWKQRFSPQALRVAWFLDESEQIKDEKAQRLGTCFLDATTGVQNFNFDSCLRQEADKPNYLLLGDSHAAAIWPALAALLPDVNVMQVNVTSCIPTVDHQDSSLCGKVLDHVYQVYLPAHPVKELLLEADWSQGDIPSLGRTLNWAKIHQVPVIVIGCVPQYDAPLARLLTYSIAWHDPALPDEHRLAGDGATEKKLRELVVDTWHVPFASPYEALCAGQECTEYADTERTIPMMDDSHHFNRFGAMLVVRRLIERGEIH
jgi:hypothetical protein